MPKKENVTKATQCYEALTQVIVEGELNPGERVRADDWARRLGISVIPVREALTKLAEDGLIQIEPFSGARVTEVDLSIVPEIFHFNLSTGNLSARLACTRLSREDIHDMRYIVQRMEESIDDYLEWNRWNGQYHRKLMERSGMQLSLRTMRRYGALWHRISRLYCARTSQSFYREVHPLHARILDAIEGGSTREAVHLMCDHSVMLIRACYEDFKRAGVADQIRDSAMPEEYGQESTRAALTEEAHMTSI